LLFFYHPERIPQKASRTHKKGVEAVSRVAAAAVQPHALNTLTFTYFLKPGVQKKLGGKEP
jgi:hypothetical protein